jgi:hypothetical protein
VRVPDKYVVGRKLQPLPLTGKKTAGTKVRAKIRIFQMDLKSSLYDKIYHIKKSGGYTYQHFMAISQG